MDLRPIKSMYTLEFASKLLFKHLRLELLLKKGIFYPFRGSFGTLIPQRPKGPQASQYCLIFKVRGAGLQAVAVWRRQELIIGIMPAFVKVFVKKF